MNPEKELQQLRRIISHFVFGVPQRSSRPLPQDCLSGLTLFCVAA